MKGGVIAILAAAVPAWFAISLWQSHQGERRLRRLAATRLTATPLEDFVRALPAIPSDVAVRAYESLQRALEYDGFPILPKDDLMSDLLLDQGKLDNVLDDEIRLSGVLMPPNISTIRTAGDFARCLYLAAQQGAPGAAPPKGVAPPS